MQQCRIDNLPREYIDKAEPYSHFTAAFHVDGEYKPEDVKCTSTDLAWTDTIDGVSLLNA